MTRETSGGWIKIERAKKHIRDLESAIVAFQQKGVNGFRAEDDPDTGDLVYRAVIKEQPPLCWGAIAGDAVHNLRSALAIMWRDALLGRGSSRKVETEFRICNSVAEFNKACGYRAAKSREKRAVDLWKATKPYPSGNDHLYWLKEVDNADKHRLLITAVAQLGEMWADASQHLPPQDHLPVEQRISYFGWRFPMIQPMCPVEHDTELHRVLAVNRATMNVKFNFPLAIAFGNPEVVKGKHLTTTLNQISQTVEGIFDAFDAAKLVD